MRHSTPSQQKGWSQKEQTRFLKLQNQIFVTWQERGMKQTYVEFYHKTLDEFFQSLSQKYE